MIKILVDTCVWIDLAKDHRQRPLLSIIEEFIQRQIVIAHISLLQARIFAILVKEILSKVVKIYPSKTG